jgi:diaminopropionate ammonia-lyase
MFDLAPTSLLDIPRIARQAGIARLFVKNEGERPLGNFKVLGGRYAGLRALKKNFAGPRRLICASDGNHGLAVAAAAADAGAQCCVFLPSAASPLRAARIENAGGEICWVEGTYDDAVTAAAAAAARGEGLLVSDTTAILHDLIVGDVMRGYERICDELVDQVSERPTHLFVQAGVGGLAASLAEGLSKLMAPPAAIVVVEPESAACVNAALRIGKPVRIGGDLKTCAEMLSCGLASAPAVEILARHGVSSMTVTEEQILAAVDMLRTHGEVATTPSGATGFAGLLSALRDTALRTKLALGPESRVILVVTERSLDPKEVSHASKCLPYER